jgi:hypothetical protein
MLPHFPPSLPTTRVLALGSRIAAAGVCGAGVSRHHPTHAQARSPVLRHAPSSLAPHPVPDNLLLTDRDSGASTGATAPSRRSSIVSVVSAGRGGRRTSSGVYGGSSTLFRARSMCVWMSLSLLLGVCFCLLSAGLGARGGSVPSSLSRDRNQPHGGALACFPLYLPKCTLLCAVSHGARKLVQAIRAASRGTVPVAGAPSATSVTSPMAISQLAAGRRHSQAVSSHHPLDPLLDSSVVR